MKKAISIIKLILLLVFIAAGVFLSINLNKIIQAQKSIQAKVETDITYFSDELFVLSKYYKYTDESSAEYWVNKSSGEFERFYCDPSLDAKLDTDSAVSNAYDEIEKWNADFISGDTFCQIEDDSEYTFYIHQLDALGYKTGKFIVVEAPHGYISSIHMHTYENKKSPDLGSGISELQAIELAFSKTSDTQLPLEQINDYLLKSEFYKDSEGWVWEISIWNITQDEIAAKAKDINTNEYFSCIINASTGEVISYEWANNSGK